MTREEAKVYIREWCPYDRQEEIIKALEQEPNTWSLDDAREDFIYDVYNTLDFLPTNDEVNRIIDSFDRVTSNIKQEPRWIPVSERLPEENRTVIASTKYGIYPEARYTKEDGWEWPYELSGEGLWMEIVFDVKAWMPLPEPYSEVEV